MTQTAVIVVSDLMFQPQIAAAVRKMRLEAVVVDSQGAIDTALAANPALVIVDLHERSLDPQSVIVAARRAGARVLAFGRHTEPATLRAARDLGADVVVRSELAEKLHSLLLDSLTRKVWP